MQSTRLYRELYKSQEKTLLDKRHQKDVNDNNTRKTSLLLEDPQFDWIDRILDVDQLNNLLKNSTEFDERRKIRSQLRKLKKDGSLESVQKSSLGNLENKVAPVNHPVPTRNNRRHNPRRTVKREYIEMADDLSAYSHIKTEAELKQLLTITEDYFEKKKIRSVIRELRKNKHQACEPKSIIKLVENSAPSTSRVSEPEPCNKQTDTVVIQRGQCNGTSNMDSTSVNEINDVLVLEKLLEDTRDFTKRREIRARMRELRSVVRDAENKQKAQNEETRKESLTVTETPDGAVVVENITTTPHGNRKVTSTMKLSRTESYSDVYEKDTVVTIKNKIPDGSELTETDEFITKTKLTRQGSKYVDRGALVTKKLRTESGSEYIHKEILLEEESMSVTTGEERFEHTTGIADIEKLSSADSDSTLHADDIVLQDGNTEDCAILEHSDSVQEAIDHDNDIQDIAADVNDSGIQYEDTSQQEDETGVVTSVEDTVEVVNDDVTNMEDTVEVVIDDVTSIEDSEKEDKVEQKEEGESLDDSRDDMQHIHVDETGNKESSGYSSNSSDEDKEVIADSKGVPAMTSNLSDRIVIDGEEVVLECGCHGNPGAIIQWYKHGKLIEASMDFRQTYDGSIARLVINEVFPEDEGQYKCVCRNERGVVETSCYITVHDNPTFTAPKIVEPLADITAGDSENVTFKCEVDAKPQPTIRWYKGGLVLKNSEDFLQSFDGRVAKMVITEIFPDDEGLYKCHFQNSVGSIDTACFLTVKENKSSKSENILDVTPEFGTNFADQLVTDGDRVEFKATLKGTPTPTVMWSKNGKQLKESDDFKMSFDGKNTVLIVADVFPEDSGLYKCVAKNRIGVAEISARLTVQEKKKSQSEIPTALKAIPIFGESFNDITVLDGDKVVLSCGVTGQPEPSVVWYRDGKTLKNSIEVKESYDGKVAQLVISEVFPEDAGLYKCVAKNDEGEAQVQGTLTVQCDDSLQAPEFSTILSDITASDGDHVVLECNVIGAPEPKITWYKNDTLITDTTYFQQSYENITARLSIPDVLWELAGTYRCQAENGAGTAHCTAKLVVQDLHKAEVKPESEEKAPEILTELQDMEVCDGDNVKFQCKVSALPKPDIKWYRGTKHLRNNRFVKQEFDGEIARLEIVEALRMDGGEYICICSNDLGEAKSTCHLTVQGKRKKDVVAEENTIETQPTKLPVEGVQKHQQKLKDVLDVLIAKDKTKDIISDDSLSESSGDTVVKVTDHNSDTLANVIKDYSKQEDDIIKTTGDMNTNTDKKDDEVDVVLKTSSSDVDNLENKSKNDGVMETIPEGCIDENDNLEVNMKTTQSSTTSDSQETSSPTSRSPQPNPDNMADVSSIEDEVQLQKMLDATDEFDERKKIRGRLREIKEKKRQVRDKELNERMSKIEDEAKRKLKMADEEKRQKMERYAEMAKTPSHVRESSRVNASDYVKQKHAEADKMKQKTLEMYQEEAKKHPHIDAGNITAQRTKERIQRADEEKEKKLDKFREMAEDQAFETTISLDDNTTMTTMLKSSRSPDGGTSMLKQTRTVTTSTTGAGGTQFGNVKQGTETIFEKLSTSSGPNTSGSVSIKQESWNSRDGLLKKTEKTQSWGRGSYGNCSLPKSKSSPVLANLGRSPGAMASLLGGKAPPTGARGAMAAFKKMDNQSGTGNKPNFLASPSKPIQRSPSAIKQMLLSWCQAMARGYEGVNITNFSSSWSDGLAFCALIHHFCPDAFDFSKLEAKNRAHNFKLAFDTAEQKADIAPLLDVEDMVRMKTPDWKCVFCYVQSFYRRFHSHSNNTPPITPTSPEVPV